MDAEGETASSDSSSEEDFLWPWKVKELDRYQLVIDPNAPKWQEDLTEEDCRELTRIFASLPLGKHNFEIIVRRKLRPVEVGRTQGGEKGETRRGRPKGGRKEKDTVVDEEGNSTSPGFSDSPAAVGNNEGKKKRIGRPRAVGARSTESFWFTVFMFCELLVLGRCVSCIDVPFSIVGAPWQRGRCRFEFMAVKNSCAGRQHS